MQLIKNLPIGSRVKFGTYKGEPLIWYVAHKNYPDISESSIMLLSEKNIGPIEMVAGTTNSTNISVLNKNYYVDIGANLHKWLNSNASNWNDKTGLSYSNTPGFLANFSTAMQNKIIQFNVNFAIYDNQWVWQKGVSCKVFPISYKWLTGNYVNFNSYAPVYVKETSKLDLFNVIPYNTAKNTWQGSFYCKDLYNPISGSISYICDASIKADETNYSVVLQSTAVSKNMYPMMAIKDDVMVFNSTNEYGYYLTEFDSINTAPVISDYDRSLGEKTSAFSIPYTITDAEGNVVTVKEYLDGTVTKTYTASLGAQNTITITSQKISQLTSGTHTIRIEASDGTSTSTRNFTFSIPYVNAPPLISDVDRSLGEKNDTFSVSYTITDAENDTVTVKEYLDGTVTKTYTASLGAQNTLNVTKQKVLQLEPGIHTLKIEASDSNGKTTRTYTFSIADVLPNISGSDTNLKGKSSGFSITYAVSGATNVVLNVTEKLDGTVLRTYAASLGAQNTLNITNTVFESLSLGDHTIKINVKDDKNNEITRVFTFQKVDTYIKFEWIEPKETNASVKSLLLIPLWDIPGANVKIDVCNNGFDVEPIWEEATSEVLTNKHHYFTNTTKTSDKWGLNIRFYVDKGNATGECVIKRYSGLYKTV